MKRSDICRVIVASLFFVAHCVSAAGFLNAQEAAVHETPPTAQEESAQPAEPTGLAPDEFYLDFKGATLLNVLTILSELAGINYVAGTEIADRDVNMVLDKVTLEDALDAIARGSNVVYDYLPNRNIYLFRASSDARDLPRLRTRVFKLYYEIGRAH